MKLLSLISCTLYNRLQMIDYKLGLTRWTGQHLSQTPQGPQLISQDFKNSFIITSAKVPSETFKYRPLCLSYSKYATAYLSFGARKSFLSLS